MRKGLTLLEVILTMVIIAIGASLAIPNLMKGIEQKRADSAIETLRTISHCIRLYKLERDIKTLTAAHNLTFAKLDTEDATGNGCLDRNQFEKTFAFPLRNVAFVDPVVLTATDTKGSGRKICLTPAGTIDRSGMIYDILSGECSAGNASRTIKE
jgi:prepilin-type N-terminal cleavage/methylation domain-containing protein